MCKFIHLKIHVEAKTSHFHYLMYYDMSVSPAKIFFISIPICFREIVKHYTFLFNSHVDNANKKVHFVLLIMGISTLSNDTVVKYKLPHTIECACYQISYLICGYF